MKDIAIYGAGGFGREVACLIEKFNRVTKIWNLIGFFDDGKRIGEKVSHFGEVLGDIDTLNIWSKDLCITLCMGSPHDILKVRRLITNRKISFPNLIDPSFSIADIDTFNIGEGNIIKGHCSVTTDVSIGNYNVLNGFVNIGHDVSLGDFNVLMPGVRVSGEVKIGDGNLLGADSFIKQQIHIGNGVTLSPLSALLTKPKDNNVYIGNPAKIFKY